MQPKDRMAKFYWLISLLVLVACSVVLVQGDAELEVAWKEFQVFIHFWLPVIWLSKNKRWILFQTQYPLKLKTAGEATKAKLNFANTHARIRAHNNNKKSTYKMEHNIFSVMVKKIWS